MASRSNERTRQVLKMSYEDSTYLVYFDAIKDKNPYTIQKLTYTPFSKSPVKEELEEYADFYSCLCFLSDLVDPVYTHGSAKI